MRRNAHGRQGYAQRYRMGGWLALAPLAARSSHPEINHEHAKSAKVVLDDGRDGDGFLMVGQDTRSAPVK
jgi:hypothetical protein